MSPLADVRLDDRDGVLVAQLVGEIDLSNVDDVRALLIARVAQDTGALVLDLTDTTYLDSTGVRLLFELTQLNPLVRVETHVEQSTQHVRTIAPHSRLQHRLSLQRVGCT